jgi:Dynamin family
MNAPGDNLCAFLRDSCARAEESLPPGRAKETVAAVLERLRAGVLRIAVGGRLNAGKSTLVNALLGEKLAATDATECTKVVSLFTYGLINQVMITRTNGQTVTLTGQPLASALAAAGCTADEVAGVEVQSSNQTLVREYTLVDTPGLDAFSGLDELSLAALSDADVLLYVMPHPGQVDAGALTRLREAAGKAGVTAASTIGVLSRIDELGDGRSDPWPAASRHAARYGRQLASLMSVVIPVAGLVAETALGDSFSESDMGPLRLLHEFAAADPSAMRTAMYSDADFRDHPTMPIPPEDRSRLLSLLGRYGIKLALAELDGGVRGASALCKALRAHSGIDVLLDQLKRQFTDLADPLRARWAIAALDRVVWDSSSPQEAAALTQLRDALGIVREHPRLRQFGLAATLTDLEAGEWEGPQDAAAELAALTAGTTLVAQLGLPPSAAPHEIRTRLIARIMAWRVIENTSTRATSRHARAIREYLESLFLALPS